MSRSRPASAASADHHPPEPRATGFPAPGFWPAIAALASVAFFAWIQLRLWTYMVDDTFISLRYAQHLAEGHGLVYNLGERVEGYTNFLWTAMLAIPYRFKLGLVPFVKIACGVFAVATAALTYRLGRVSVLAADATSDRWPALLASILFLLTPAVSVSAAEGLETMLFSLLLVAAVYRFFVERDPRALPVSAVLLAACAMTRPDAVLFLPLFIAAAVLTRRPVRYLAGFTVAFVAVFGGYFALRAAYYGQLLPNTFYAKRGGDIVLLDRAWTETRAFVAACGGWVWLAAIPALLARRTRAAAAILAGVILLRVAFELWSGGPWMGHFRFLTPILPYLDLLSIAGLVVAFRQARIRNVALAALCACRIAIAWSAYYPAEEHDRLGYGQGLRRAHLALGERIQARTEKSAVIAMDDAGIGPLVADRTNIDMLGLNDPHIARLSGRFAEKYDVVYVLGRHPDLIVLVSRRADPASAADFLLAGHAAMFRDPEFQSRYAPARSFQFTTRYFLVAYRRRDSSAVPADF